MTFPFILMSFSVPRMTWHTIRDDTAEHAMYVVEMAFVVILMSFSMPRMTWRTIRDDTAEHRMSTYAVSFMFQTWAAAQIGSCIPKGNCPSLWATAQASKCKSKRCIYAVMHASLWAFAQLDIHTYLFSTSASTTALYNALPEPAAC